MTIPSTASDAILSIFWLSVQLVCVLILYRGCYTQRARAERAEAALAKVEATVAECERAAVEHKTDTRSEAAKTLLAGMRKRAAKLDNPIDLTGRSPATLTPISDGAASRVACLHDLDAQVRHNAAMADFRDAVARSDKASDEAGAAIDRLHDAIVAIPGRFLSMLAKLHKDGGRS